MLKTKDDVLMIKKQTNELVVGTFVILGFILLAMLVFLISGVYLFRPGYKVDVLYTYVSILDRGAPVRMAGVRVGEVNDVKLYYDANKQKTLVRVRLFIEKAIEVRKNYLFKVQGTHVLSEPHIEITPVTGEAELIKNGDLIEGVNPVAMEEIIESAHDMIKDVSIITHEVRTIFEEKHLQRTLENVDDSTQALNVILERIESGHGTLGQLVMNEELYQDFRGFVSEIKTRPWRLIRRDKGSEDKSGKKWWWPF